MISLDDLLYPVGAPGKLLKTLTGSYVVPLGRRRVARSIADRLSRFYAESPTGAGGYVLLLSRRVAH